MASTILKQKIDYNNQFNIKRLIDEIIYLSPRNHKSLRTENIGNITSKIATIPLVRKFVNNQQKIIVKEMLKLYIGCVIDGRDIGSKVFRDAKIKLFIEVQPEIRAKRRHKQLIALGEKSIYGQILKEINLRDNTDKNRKESPLVKPAGAIVINNSSCFQKTIRQIKKALIKIK
ncbi:uncharacterized protein METZ01_LOCUS125578 [marine metagenome]|uniref:(d)CMP kinase n=1 Tax=marine metagenome TaxID=408172 RepID=A0A381Y6S5_9ZZZZ